MIEMTIKENKTIGLGIKRIKQKIKLEMKGMEYKYNNHIQ